VFRRLRIRDGAAMLAVVSAFTLASCSRANEANFIGTWKFENEQYIEELTFNRDHSFASVREEKHAISHPPVAEEQGTWRIDGDILQMDAAWRDTPNERRKRTGHFDARSGRLIALAFDFTKSNAYERLRLPSCHDARAITSGDVLETALIGSWWVHYETSDLQFRFLPNHHFASFSYHSDGWHPDQGEGEWRVEGPRLVIKDADLKTDSKFLILGLAENCFSAENIDRLKLVFERVRENEISAPPPGASPSTPSSPPPTETPSPAH